MNPGNTRIIGIDPGLRATGFGIIDCLAGNQLLYVCAGTIRTQIPPSKSQPQAEDLSIATAPIGRAELAPRLKEIFTSVSAVITEYRPNCAAIEKVFVNVNPQSTLLLGQARGAALVALAMQLEQIHEYTALQLKQSVVGYGRASKQQVQAMVQRLLQLANPPSSDAADALGIAITHAHSLTHQSLLTAHARLTRVRRGRSF